MNECDEIERQGPGYDVVYWYNSAGLWLAIVGLAILAATTIAAIWIG